jgi:hypothetical protein
VHPKFSVALRASVAADALRGRLEEARRTYAIYRALDPKVRLIDPPAAVQLPAARACPDLCRCDDPDRDAGVMCRSVARRLFLWSGMALTAATVELGGGADVEHRGPVTRHDLFRSSHQHRALRMGLPCASC